MSKYKLVRELGRNQEGGRITHLATDTSLDPPINVVIKEFRFAVKSANWSGFKAHEREIQFLRELEHPRIAKYIDSFETKSGFCLVQEYKDAPSLARRRSFKAEEIKQIAVSVLEILVYLQKRTPPIIHRDIKPENILVDQQWNAYLIDFGFARIRGGELALSSVAAGTPGFMPPEEQFGRALTEASDLYSLGATLICLLTGTRSVDVGKLIDDDYRFNFKGKLGNFNPRFIAWLEKMVTPNVKQRYANAFIALEALKPLNILGKATIVKLLNSNIKPKFIIPVVGLATLSIASLLGKSWLISGIGVETHNKTVRQLLDTRECRKCDLRNVNLRGIDLEGAYLESSNLESANLEGVNLKGANLRKSNLRNASLQGTNLQGANLEMVNLSGANLKEANLTYSLLQDANFNYANLEKANLTGAQADGAIFKYPKLLGITWIDGKTLKCQNPKDVGTCRRE